jgi:tetratricopeptide (TPR) repeat protein
VTGDVLDDEQATVAGKQDVLKALSQIAAKFRTRAGESSATVEQHGTPLTDAATSSLEALKIYGVALKVAYSTGQAAAVPILKRAIEIDPKFAIAHAYLGIWYGVMGDSVRSAESLSNAYRLRNRTSDRERYFIAANYDLQVRGNLEDARETCESWAQTYPRDKEPHGLLASTIYQELGKYEKSIEQAKIAIGIDPDFTPGYVDQIWSNLFLERLDEAENVLRLASERKMEFDDLFVLRYGIAFLRRDEAGMERASALSKGKPGVEDWISDEEAFVLAYSGHLRDARKKSQRAVDLAQKADEPERAAMYEAGAAVWEAFFGNAAEARRSATAALDLSKSRDVEYGAAFALALLGDSSRSQTLAKDLARRFPDDTAARFVYVPTVGAVLGLNNGEPRSSIDLLETARPHELAAPASMFGFFGFLYPLYTRGNAYLAGGQYSEAIAEFREILSHRSLVFCDPVGAVARLQLARAFKLSGDNPSAKAAYQDFLTLWKDADQDIPILQQAKAEYAKLAN